LLFRLLRLITFRDLFLDCFLDRFLDRFLDCFLDRLVERLIAFCDRLVERLIVFRDRLIERFFDRLVAFRDRLVVFRERLVDRLVAFRERLVDRLVERFFVFFFCNLRFLCELFRKLLCDFSNKDFIFEGIIDWFTEGVKNKFEFIFLYFCLSSNIFLLFVKIFFCNSPVLDISFKYSLYDFFISSYKHFIHSRSLIVSGFLQDILYLSLNN